MRRGQANRVHTEPLAKPCCPVARVWLMFAVPLVYNTLSSSSLSYGYRVFANLPTLAKSVACACEHGGGNMLSCPNVRQISSCDVLQSREMLPTLPHLKHARVLSAAPCVIASRSMGCGPLGLRRAGADWIVWDQRQNWPLRGGH